MLLLTMVLSYIVIERYIGTQLHVVLNGKRHRLLYRVKDWYGHKKLDQTLKYISLAKLYDDNAGSWLNRALKRRRNVGEKCSHKRITEKKPSFVKITRRENSGRGGIRTRDHWLRRPVPYPG